jgi:hypothetical protein
MPAESEKYSKKPGSGSGDTSKAKRTTDQELSANFVSFTIDMTSGRIAWVEAIDSAGDRHELSAEETSQLASQRMSTLEDVLERAFEAGISSVLDEAPVDEVEAESEEESRLRRLILRPMIERSAVRHLLKREVLVRALLGTLLQDAAATRTSARTSASASAHKPSPAPSRSTASPSRRQPPRGRPH